MLPDTTASPRWSLRELIDGVILYRGTPPDEEARIVEHARLETVRITRPLLLAACSVGLLWWPFDLVLHADRPRVVRVFALWRIAIIAYCFAYCFTCDRWSVLRRNHAVYGTFLGAGLTFVIATSLGSLGSLGQPWSASLYFALIMTFPFLVRLRVRVAATATIALAALAACSRTVR